MDYISIEYIRHYTILIAYIYTSLNWNIICEGRYSCKLIGKILQIGSW